MRVLIAMVLGLALCALLTGCSTHRKDLEKNVPPQGSSSRVIEHRRPNGTVSLAGPDDDAR